MAVQPRRISRRCYSAATRCPPFVLGAGATPRITCIEFALLALRGETRAVHSTGWHKGAGEPPASRRGGVKTSIPGTRVGTCKYVQARHQEGFRMASQHLKCSNQCTFATVESVMKRHFKCGAFVPWERLKARRASSRLRKQEAWQKT